MFLLIEDRIQNKEPISVDVPSPQVVINVGKSVSNERGSVILFFDLTEGELVSAV